MKLEGDKGSVNKILKMSGYPVMKGVVNKLRGFDLFANYGFISLKESIIYN